jgi:hypothetical protein
MTPQTLDQLKQIAANQVDTELGGQIAPLQSQIGSVDAAQGTANKNLGTMFDSLMPYVQGAAQAVQGSHDAAQQAEQGIFSQAQLNLSNLAKQRAQEAQTLAQQIGGPVAAGQFTESVTPSQQYLGAVGPGALLHSLALGEAGNQEAQAFAGKVFPLVRTEQQALLTRHFEDQRKQLQDQITQLKQSRSGAINSRLSDLQQKERDYQLQVAQQNLDKLKAAHDWTATKRTLHNDDVRLTLAQQQAANDRAGLTGTINGKPTQQAKELAANIAHMSAADKLQARQLGLSEKEFAQRQITLKQNAATAKTAQNVQQQKLAMDIIDQATNPQPGKSFTQTVTTEITQQAAVLNKSAYSVVGADGKTHYFLDRKVTLPGSTGVPMQDPQRLYELLLGYKIPPAMAKKLVKSKLGTTDFEPNKVNYTVTQLQGMPFSEMRGVAIQLGFRPDPKNPMTKKQLINYIVKHRS